MNSWLLLIELGAWLSLSFFLSGMEAGVQVLSRLRIRQWLRLGRRGARDLLGYLDRPENFLWTILVGNTLANFAALCLLLAELQSRFGAQPAVFWPVLLGVGGTLFLLTELLPKTLFRRYPNRLCLALVWPFRLVHLVLTPLVTLVEYLAALLVRFTRGHTPNGRLFGNREELRALLHDGGGALIPGERALINRVLDAQNITVGRLATPLTGTARLTTATPLTEFLKLAREQAIERLPIWDTSPRQPRVQGVLTLHRVLYHPDAPEAAPGSSVTCGDLLVPAVFLDESMHLDQALRRLQRGGSQIGIVLGPGGRELGTVTLDQLLQTLFGELTG